MKNKMSDLLNHLFAEMERLGDEEMTDEELKIEIERAKAIKDVSNAITSNINTLLKAEELRTSNADGGFEKPKMLQ